MPKKVTKIRQTKTTIRPRTTKASPKSRLSNAKPKPKPKTGRGSGIKANKTTKQPPTKLELTIDEKRHLKQLVTAHNFAKSLRGNKFSPKVPLYCDMRVNIEKEQPNMEHLDLTTTLNLLETSDITPCKKKNNVETENAKPYDSDVIYYDLGEFMHLDETKPVILCNLLNGESGNGLLYRHGIVKSSSKKFKQVAAEISRGFLMELLIKCVCFNRTNSRKVIKKDTVLQALKTMNINSLNY